MSTTSENKRTIREFFSAVSREGMGPVLPRFATQDLRWWTPGIGEMSQETLIAGVAGLSEALETPFVMTVHDVMAEGDCAAAEVECHAALKNGTTYNNFYHFKFYFKDGKFAFIKEYNDTKHASDIWGAVVPPLPQK